MTPNYYLCLAWKATPIAFGPQWLPAVGLTTSYSILRSSPKWAFNIAPNSSAISNASV